MLAAEVIFEALVARDFSAKQLQRYEQLVNESWIIPELRKVQKLSRRLQARSLAGTGQYGLAIHYRRARLGHFRSRSRLTPVMKR